MFDVRDEQTTIKALLARNTNALAERAASEVRRRVNFHVSDAIRDVSQLIRLGDCFRDVIDTTLRGVPTPG